MSQVLVVAEASLREHSRRRLLAFFAVGSLVLSGALLVLVRDRSGQVLFGPEVSLAVVASLGVFQLLAAIAALAVSMGNIGQPFISGEALPILARPVARWQYAGGRFAASVAVVLGLCVLLAVQTQIVQFVATGGMLDAVWGHYAAVAFNLTVVVAVATLVSTVVATPILVAVVSFVVYQIVGSLGSLHRLVEAARISGPVARAVEVAWYVSPKFLTSPLQARQAQAQTFTDQLLVRNTPGLVLWAVGYLVAILALTVTLVRRKEV